MDVLKIEKLRKEYSSGFTLQNVSFSLEQGCIMGLIGENGAGKTTTLKLMLNLLKRDGGNAFFFGKEILSYEKEIKSRIGVVLDECCFHNGMLPKDISWFMKDIYPEWQEKLFYDYLDRLAIPVNKRISEYSKGMKVKLNIACALAHSPKLLILDEPTSGLDPLVRNKLLDIFHEYIMDGEHSVLLSTHITEDLEKSADYITFLHEGRFVFQREKDDLLDSHGLLKCSKADLEKVERSLLTGIRVTEFGAEAMVTDVASFRRRYPRLAVDHIRLDEIMLYYSSPSVGRKGEGAQ